MNGLRKRAAIGACLALLLFGGTSSTARAESSGSVQYHSEQVSYNGKSFSVQWVAVDLTDPYLRVKPVVASEGIGHVEDFAEMMNEHNAVAGINGTFFDAYEADESKRFPNGLMIRSGEIVRSGENPSFAVLTDKTTLVQQTRISLKINVTHQGETYPIAPWGVNTYYDDGDRVVWYTPDFGGEIAYPDGTKIVVQDHQVTKITQDAVAVPEDGYVLFVGNSSNNRTYLLPHVHVGDRVSLAARAIDMATQREIPLTEWEAAVGAGPRLLADGEVDVDFARDGFDDPKIVSAAGVRSFIGTDRQGRMVMGTMSAATVTDMAHVLQQLGLVNAINLDGGASSALYYDGTVVRKPGRQLSNAWIVERYDRPQVQIVVNGQFVEDFRGFIVQDTTMVPFRGIFEKIDADFRWDEDSRTLFAEKGRTKLVLQPDVITAKLNGSDVRLDAAPVIVDDHLYVPLRFIADALGAKLDWNQQLYRAALTLPQ